MWKKSSVKQLSYPKPFKNTFSYKTEVIATEGYSKT